MVDIQSAATEIRRGIKKRRRKKPQGKNIMSASATRAAIKIPALKKCWTKCISVAGNNVEK